MSRHTPGPWRIGAIESGRYCVDGANGEEVTGWLDSEGDALLIAAAPELLEALKRLIATGLDEREYHEFMSNPAHYARAAINKATGGNE